MRKTNQAFTLIEMLIAMAILAFISVGVYQLTAGTFEMREKLEVEADFYNSVRVALSQMERDILMIFTPQLKAFPGNLGQRVQVQPGTQPTGGDNATPFDPGQPTAFWGARLNRSGIRASRFQGEANKVSFISNSHVRLYQNSPESEFAKIIYTVEDDRESKNANNQMDKMLVRYEDPVAFIDDGKKSETEVRYIIMRAVKSFKIEYLDGSNDRWQNRWDTESADTKDKYPALIRVTVEVIPPPPMNPENTFVAVQMYKPELAL
jgi:general secretion pathway protein J